VRHRAVLIEELRGSFATWSRAALVDALTAAGVPCGPINTIPESFADPQLAHREMLRRLPHPRAGSVPQVVSPMRFTDSPLDYDRPPPGLGEHTDALLREIGMTDDEIARLRAAGVV